MSDVVSEYPELVLRPHQEEHYQRVREILEVFYFYMDASKQGTGKTYIAGKLSLDLGLPIMVICPLSARHIWNDISAEYGVPIYDIPGTGGVMTYDSLSSKKGKQPKHGLLIRDDTFSKPVYYPSPVWQAIVDEGVLLIVDECQLAKNDNTRNRALAGLMQSIYGGGNSRAAFLSGTPMNEAEHTVNFLRMVGFIQSSNLVDRGRATGVQEAIEWASRMDPTEARKFVQSTTLDTTQAGAIEYVYQLFIRIIRKGIMSIMPNPLDRLKNIKNGFYYLDPESADEYREGIIDLIKATRYRPETNDEAVVNEMTHDEITQLIGRTGRPLPATGAVLAQQTLAEGQVSLANLGRITKALIRIQKAKVRAAIRVATEIITTPRFNSLGQRVHPKVIIFASYYEVIDALLEGLAEFNPVELTGRVKEKDRVRNIKAFQTRNTDVQALVGNPIVGGLSINLQDDTGLFPPFLFIFPDYRINELMQASDRTTRPGIVEETFVRIFYGLSGTIETAIIGAMARKGKIMREVTFEQTLTGALFPDQFENEIEERPGSIFSTTHVESALRRLRI